MKGRRKQEEAARKRQEIQRKLERTVREEEGARGVAREGTGGGEQERK